MEFHEYANIFPMLDAEGLDSLRSDIEKNGLLDPVVTYEGKILDGRNRDMVCAELGITPDTIEYTGDDPLGFVLSKNLERRHLSTAQRADIADELANKPHGWNRYAQKVDTENSVSITQAEAAERLNVSVDSIQQMRKVKEQGIPELVDRVRSGNMVVSEAAKIAKMPKEQQKKAIDEGKSSKQIEIEVAQQRNKEQSVEATKRNPPTLYIGDGVDWIDRQEPCDLLLTDPPYMTDVEDIEAFVMDWLPVALSKVKTTGFAFVFIGAYPDEVQAYLNAKSPPNVELCQLLVWTYKNTLGNNPRDRYKQNYQNILFYRGVDAPDIDCPITSEQWAVQEVNAPDGRQGDRFHSWQKPMELAERLIRHTTKQGDTVYDPFACTGTFLLAANKQGRNGSGAEISEENAKIAIGRGAKYE